MYVLPQEETFGIAYSAVRTVDLLLHLIAQMSVQGFYIVHCAGNFSGNILSLCGPNRFLSCIDGFNDLPLPTLSGSGAPHLFLQVMCLIYNDQLDFIVNSHLALIPEEQVCGQEILVADDDSAGIA